MALSRVPGEDELYVGGIFTLSRKNTLADTGITHVISVLKYDFKDFEDWEKYEHLSIEVDDVEDENLLGEFERSGSWIEEGLRKGKDDHKGSVLVHCAMGRSRSVTIVIAYLLRRYPQHTVDSALALVREAREMAEPNDGFMEQLHLYKEMGCPHDIDSQPKYQRWLYQKEVGLALAAGMAPDTVRFEDEQVQEESREGKQVELRCRKCRRTLATSPYLINHLPKPVVPPQQSSTGPIASLDRVLPPQHTACTHHFLQPLSWMRAELEQGLLSGRLECPNVKCNAKLGQYIWQGMKCSCGVWICPAFSLQKGRVDEVVLRAEPAQVPGSRPKAGGIRSPPDSKSRRFEKM
ncbi:protein-tyrosine phosphatase-like protein [Calycina marina]|uniref:protein-tyrosine-phosphatase n=1 Tax=Calycina marina TaxID=1763456 RepID=A0A9P8CD30_9HELO|nr:protein-tyrosine phosphatase-like protein [Calycina marina]